MNKILFLIEHAPVRQAMLGCVPVHRLLDFSIHKREIPNAIVEVKKVTDGSPRSFSDYAASIHRDRLPAGVELIEL